uniref:Fruit-specific protein-like n=1 Tax=Nicotiana sylvestris TaxID=4096 RepID=A0A1U7V8V2_NICSY|nr:PREDICTED: fruit-specific protein-like [Nicotiana sylvestris]
MALLKINYFFVFLLMAAIINLSWFSEIQGVAARDIDHGLSGLKKRLLPQVDDYIFTCYRPCTEDKECSDCALCCSCHGPEGFKSCSFW